MVEKAYKWAPLNPPAPVLCVGSQLPDWERIMEVLIVDGLDELVNKVQLTVGVPFAPMLAHPTKGTPSIHQSFSSSI